MKHVFRRIAARSQKLAQNRLFTEWLASSALPPEAKLAFVPMSLDFVMGFRDFNRYYVRYPKPQSELEEAINTHAAEDETHSALLLEDWVALDLDRRLGWAPRDVFWWLTSDETRSSRRADFRLMELAFHNPDPLLRFAIIESMEAAGNVFFTRTVPIAEKLGGRSSPDFPYFGKYHLDRETGHLQHASERAFLKTELDEARREHALALVDEVFDVFEFHFDTWESFARAQNEKRWRYSPKNHGHLSAMMRPDEPHDVTDFLSLDHPRDAAGVARALADERKRRFGELWRSPGYTWVREAWPGEFHTMMRYFFLQWVVDNWACADYFTFDTTYAQPRTPLERGINRLSLLYASEMKRRYVEWESLELDEFTGWTASEALRHYWLDERVEEHREVFADLRKLTFRYPSPLHRYWIMKCFVRFGDTLMHSLGAAMKNGGEPDESFITFAGHPSRLHPDLPHDPEADAAIENLERMPLASEDVAIIRKIIAETFDQEARRSDITWRIVKEGRFESFHQKWKNRSLAPTRDSRTRVRAALPIPMTDELASGS